jgi:alkyldihydroxyacetonephosphate synthase
MTKRWNGWGDDATTYPLPDPAAAHLEALVGPGTPSLDASFESVVGEVPRSSLPAHPLISIEPIERVHHARGQSLPDWVALRSGRIGTFPDGVAYPTDDEEVRSLLIFARERGFRVIPFGGGTSVVGHVNPRPQDAPVLTLDLSRMKAVHEIDEMSLLATVDAGCNGPDLETALQNQGLTLGHYPQSFEYSTVGGWVATRSSGQQSHYYGRIEDLFAGGHLETPLGPLDLAPHPASAAGPDLKQIVLGSEGRLGVITRAVLRICRLPESEAFYGIFFHHWEAGVAAVRTISQELKHVSMLRLSDAAETGTSLALMGHTRRMAWADRGLRLLGFDDGRCLLIVGLTGSTRSIRQSRRQVAQIAHHFGGMWVGTYPGNAWRKTRFLAPYLRNTLWERGFALDTLETAVRWSAVSKTATAIKGTLGSSLADFNERVLAMIHLSHVYPHGASVYATYIFRRTVDPDETLERWKKLKARASDVILDHGGTISHQHGVGEDHARYMPLEKGLIGLSLIEAIRRQVDPEGIMNPGKLLPSA